MSYHNPVFLTREQSEVIRAAAASVPNCWRERFLNSVQDQLLGHEPDHVSDEDVLVTTSEEESDGLIAEGLGQIYNLISEERERLTVAPSSKNEGHDDA